MKKRLLSVLLAACKMVQMLPVQVLANEAADIRRQIAEGKPVTEQNSKKYEK